MGLLIIVVSVAITTLGLMTVHRRWAVDLRRQHNDIAGFVIAVVGVVYAVLMASIAVMAWEIYNDADAIVATEADLVSDIYIDAQGLGETTSAALRKHLLDYADTVLKVEWPAMREGRALREGEVSLGYIQSVLSAFRSDSPTQTVYLAQVLTRLNELYDARHERMLLVGYGIHPVIWFAVAMGGLITVAFTFFFGLSNIKVHLLMSNGLAVAIALVITIIAAMDHPFLGEVDISPEPFEMVLQHMGRQER